jgi:superfamily I DNA/RNA helicase
MKLSLTTTKIYGAPGTGKTTRMLELLSQEIARGTKIERIGFVTHTVAARVEALDRIGKSVNEADLKYFRTIHGICYSQLGLHRSQVMQTNDYLDFGASCGVPFSTNFHVDVDASGTPGGYQHSPGNEILAIRQLAAAKCCSITELREQWPKDVTTDQMKKTLDQYLAWKEANAKFDFVDMLQFYAKHGSPIDVDVLFLDEAQDLSLQQWAIFAIMSRTAKRVYIAGDDDQSIYAFIGADPYGFLDFKATQDEVLPKTWRLKDNVWDYAQKIIRRVSKRKDKKITTSGEGGSIDYYNTDVRHIDINPKETTMFISPHNNQLAEFAEELDSRGIPYNGRGWTPYGSSNVAAAKAYLALRAGEPIGRKDAATMLDKLGDKARAKEYRAKARTDSTPVTSVEGVNLSADWVEYLSRSDRDRQRNATIRTVLQRSGWPGVLEPPKVSLTTYHGSKGREADHVILLTDCYRKAYDHSLRQPDDERRLAYVGVTRAKSRVSIILPQTEMYMRSLV